MATTLGFTIEIQGTQAAINTATDVRLAIQQINEELKDPSLSGQEVEQLNDELVRLKGTLKQAQAAQRDAIKKFEATSEGTSAYRRLSAQLVVARNNAKNLQAQARLTGEDLTQSIEAAVLEARRLDAELKDIDSSVGQFQRNVGNYPQTIAGVFGQVSPQFAQFGESIEEVGNIATRTGKVIAASFIVFELVNQLAQGVASLQDFTEEFRQLRGEVSQLTQTQGEELDTITAKVSALASTYDKDVNEVLRSANALSRQFGISQEEALEKINIGLAAGAELNGQFLDQISEYSVQFKDAEASADGFIKTLIRSTQEGVFSDQGAAVVEEFGFRIREQTTATREALENAFGRLFTQGLFDNLNNGSITTTEALAQVATQLKEVDLTAQQTQTIVADVFGGPGEKVGIDFIESLGDIDSGLDSVVEGFNEYQEQQLETTRLNEELAVAQLAVAQEFFGASQEATNFATRIRTFVLRSIAEFFNDTRILRAQIFGIGESIKVISGQIAAFFQRSVITAQIATKELAKLNPFGKTTEQLEAEIQKLRQLREVFNFEGKTVAEAYNEGFEERLKQLNVGKTISDQVFRERAEVQKRVVDLVKEVNKEIVKEEQEAAQKRVLIIQKLTSDIAELESKQLDVSADAIFERLDAAREAFEEVLKKERIEEALKTTIFGLDQLSQAFSLVSDAITEGNERELEALDRRVEEQIAFVDRLEEQASRATGARRLELEQQLQDERQALEEQTEQREEAQREQAKQEKAIAIIQSIINTALAVTRALATGNIAQSIASGVIGGAQTAIIAAQPLAEGGVVTPVRLQGGKIVKASNIKTLPNGDDVLATVKRGEVILNQRQQDLLGGANTFRSIGVPGFGDGGFIGAPISAPNLTGVMSAQATNQAIAALDRKTDAINSRFDRLRTFVVSEDISSDLSEGENLKTQATFQ